MESKRCWGLSFAGGERGGHGGARGRQQEWCRAGRGRHRAPVASSAHVYLLPHTKCFCGSARTGFPLFSVFFASIRNQVATELLDDSLLGSGLLPAVRQALYGTCLGFGGSHVPSPDASRQPPLLTSDAVVVPRAATLWVQAVEVGVPPPERLGGLDMSPLDRYRCVGKAGALGWGRASACVRMCVWSPRVGIRRY